MAYDDGLKWPFAGVDEVGRGPLAGPVVACALILPKGCKIEGVRDSKKISRKLRKALEAKIIESAVCYAYGIISAPEIDETNILIATLKAMAVAIEGLELAPKIVIVDGIHAPASKYATVCLKKGDSLSHTIAASSILAKEYRDRLMDEFHDEYPEYGFSSHKGYGTKKHFEAIYLHGLCQLHRRSFLKKSDANLQIG